MKFIQHIFIYIIFILLSNIASASSPSLYPNEQLVTLKGFQSLVYFSKGNLHKPLIIFVPGNAHLARIGYGYPEGDPKDFLAYWINKQGYSFLGVSYPTDNKIYSQIYPEFNINDWGDLVISAAKDVIKKEGLSNDIIIVGWSMAGSIVQTANLSAKRNGLNLKLFIGLSAVPPIPYMMQSSFVMNRKLENNLADRTFLYPWLSKWVDEQGKYNEHTIIPKNIYVSQFLGDIPISLGAEGYHFENNKFIYNVERTINETGIFKFSDLPWIAQIHDDSSITMKISVIDPYAWNFLLMQMINQNYLINTNVSKMNAVNSKIFVKFINEIPMKLTMTVHGNHIFFIGQKGAHETADDIDILIKNAAILKNQEVSLTSSR